jgi:integrase/recombinase XerD
MNQFPCLIRTSTVGGEARFALGDPLVDSYLAFVAGRSRPSTLRAVAHDLKTFLSLIDKHPVEVVAADVFEFVADQRGDRSVVRISDGESGLSARTIARRLSSISGFYAYLVARGDTLVATNPVPRGLSTRRRGDRRRQLGSREPLSRSGWCASVPVPVVAVGTRLAW